LRPRGESVTHRDQIHCYLTRQGSGFPTAQLTTPGNCLRSLIQANSATTGASVVSMREPMEGTKLIELMSRNLAQDFRLAIDSPKSWLKYTCKHCLPRQRPPPEAFVQHIASLPSWSDVYYAARRCLRECKANLISPAKTDPIMRTYRSQFVGLSLSAISNQMLMPKTMA